MGRGTPPILPPARRWTDDFVGNQTASGPEQAGPEAFGLQHIHDALGQALLRKDVVVAGGRVVVSDDGLHVEGERAQVVDAAANPLAVAAATFARAAVGQVVGDRAPRDVDRGAAGDIDTAAQAVAAVA